MRLLVSDLSDAYEYALVLYGQSNSRPWGAKSDGFRQAPELQQDATGMALGLINAANLTPSQPIGTQLTITLTQTVVSANQWQGAQIRFYDATGGGNHQTKPLGIYATVVKDAHTPLQTTSNQLIITLSVATPGGLPASIGAYLVRPNMKWSFYPQVRILTPYQPESIAISTNVPYPDGQESLRVFANQGVNTATSFADLGVFLPFTFNEGVDAAGISSDGDSSGASAAHPATNATDASGLTFTTAVGAWPADALAGGSIIVEWTDTTANGNLKRRSWGTITTGGTTTRLAITGGWQGDGTPSIGAGATIDRWEAWVPHYNNSPHALLHGFRYPNNDMQPYAQVAPIDLVDARVGDTRLHNTSRGISTFCYGDRFGAMLMFAWRLSAAIGKRINVIYLGVNSSSQVMATTQNYFGFFGKVGWYDYAECLDWAPEHVGGQADRLKRLITVIAPNALTLENNTKPLRVLGVGLIQGEGDAINRGGRTLYEKTLLTSMSWVRDIITSAGFSPYASNVKIPFVMPRITHLPWELTGTFTYYSIQITLDGDTYGYVNNAIVETLTADEFGAFTVVGDLPKLVTDFGHYNGIGEAVNGQRLADALVPVIERALAYGSPCLRSPFVEELAICNMALTHIGERQITSFTDGSAQATLCLQLYGTARDELLQLREWPWAVQRVQGVKVQGAPPQWAYSYVVPGYALSVYGIRRIVSDQSANDSAQTAPNLSTAVIPVPAPSNSAATPSGVTAATSTLTDLPVVMLPLEYTIEASPNGGHRVLYTNESDIELRILPKQLNPRRFPPMFRTALTHNLAAKLARAIVKGPPGEAVAEAQLKLAAGYLRAEGGQESRQMQSNSRTYIPNHIAQR